MKIQFLGATGCVTGSCYHVTAGSTSFLVDCGMFQGDQATRAANWTDLPFPADSVDFVLLTHAHIDHCGLLPKLVREGFKGPIYATPPTVALCRHLLPDSGRIQESDAENKNRRLARSGEAVDRRPLYTEDEANRAVQSFKEVALERELRLSDDVTVLFRNAGHILGSAFIEVTLSEPAPVSGDGSGSGAPAGRVTRKVVFSGDLGASNHPIIKDPETFEKADFLLIESTYGDRNREDDAPEARRNALAQAVNDTCPQGGNLVIPGFAVGRTQDLLHDFLILLEEKRIPPTEIWVDSPLAVEVTRVFSTFTGEYDEQALGLMHGRRNLFESPSFHFSKTVTDSMQLNTLTGVVIISASGMCDAGRIKHHLRHNLYKRECAVLFVGYQGEGTLGRRLLEGANRVQIHGVDVAVRARILQIPGYSGHADQHELLAWAGAIRELSGAVFVVHGEEPARAELARLLERQGRHTFLPSFGDAVDLLSPLESWKIGGRPWPPATVARRVPLRPEHVAPPSPRPHPPLHVPKHAPEVPRLPAALASAVHPTSGPSLGFGAKVDEVDVAYALLTRDLAAFMIHEADPTHKQVVLGRLRQVLLEG
jgi:metallo-beta-lactamase family protein